MVSSGVVGGARGEAESVCVVIRSPMVNGEILHVTVRRHSCIGVPVLTQQVGSKTRAQGPTPPLSRTCGPRPSKTGFSFSTHAPVSHAPCPF